MSEQHTTLPEISEETIVRIETDVFERIAEEPSKRPIASRRSSRRRAWLTGGGIAAAFLVGVLVTPTILGSVGGTDTVAGGYAPTGFAQDGGGAAPEMATESSAATAIGDSDLATTDTAREVITSASATVLVSDIPAAVIAIGDLAEEAGGYVESTSVTQPQSMSADSVPAPDGGFGWISVRVPSAELVSVVDALSEHGEVRSSSTSDQDVTATAIDLRARVAALETSVTRLTELMEQSGTVSELIEAEVALTNRQAELESYRQQLAALDDQVAMSSLQVELVRTQTVADADPAGFTDGLFAGWNGLIVSVNALVVALGFLLPWLAVASVALLLVWGIVRWRRRSRPRE